MTFYQSISKTTKAGLVLDITVDIIVGYSRPTSLSFVNNIVSNFNTTN